MGFIHRVRGAVGALWPITIIGIILGAVVGVSALGLASGGQTASALVRIGQPVDPTQLMTGQTASADSQTGYVAGEIAYLADPAFSRSVSDRVGRSVTVTATQNAQSPTITFAATSPTGPEAVDAVNAAIAEYRDHVGDQTTARGNAAMSAIDAVVSDLREQGGQSIRIDELNLQRVAIEVQTKRAPDVQVLQEPTVAAGGGGSNALLGGVAGGLAGGIVFLAVAFGWRKFTGIIPSADAVADQTPLLRPIVALGSVSPRTETPTGARARTARTLFAQLPSGQSRVIVVVGATGDSGSAEVAALIEFAAVETGSHTDRVVDAGAIGDSADLGETLSAATTIVVVARTGVDTFTDLDGAVGVARAHHATVSVVCTHRAWWARTAAGPTPAATAARPATAIEKPVDGATSTPVVADEKSPTEADGIRTEGDPERVDAR